MAAHSAQRRLYMTQQTVVIDTDYALQRLSAVALPPLLHHLSSRSDSSPAVPAMDQHQELGAPALE